MAKREISKALTLIRRANNDLELATALLDYRFAIVYVNGELCILAYGLNKIAKELGEGLILSEMKDGNHCKYFDAEFVMNGVKFVEVYISEEFRAEYEEVAV